MVEAGDLQDVEQKVSLHVKGKVPRFARSEGDATSVPLGRREHMVRDYAPRADRTLDVRTYAQWTQSDDWTVRIPAGAKVRSAPTSAHGQGPFGSYATDVTVTPTSIRVKTSVALSEDADLGRGVRGVPRLVRRGRPCARAARNGGVQVSPSMRAVASASPSRRRARASRRGARRSITWERPRRSVPCATRPGPSRDGELIGRWALMEMLAPGGTPANADAARKQARRPADGPSRGMMASLARAVADDMHGDPRSAADAFLMTLARAATSPDEDAPLIGWYAARHLSGLRDSVTDLFVRDRSALDSLLAHPGHIGWRAVADLEDWRAVEVHESAERTGEAYEDEVVRRMGCARGVRLAGPFGHGVDADRDRSFAAESAEPWPKAWAPDPVRRSVPHVLSTTQKTLPGRRRRASARRDVLRRGVLRQPGRPRARRGRAGRRRRLDRRREGPHAQRRPVGVVAALRGARVARRRASSHRGARTLTPPPAFGS